MKIGELAKICGVATSTIRYYEKIGILPYASRSLGGYRDYPKETITQLRTIKLSQELGFSLDEIAAVFNPSNPLDHSETLTHLKNKRQDINRLIKELEDKRTQIDELTVQLETLWGNGECMDDNDILTALRNVQGS